MPSSHQPAGQVAAACGTPPRSLSSALSPHQPLCAPAELRANSPAPLSSDSEGLSSARSSCNEKPAPRGAEAAAPAPAPGAAGAGAGADAEPHQGGEDDDDVDRDDGSVCDDDDGDADDSVSDEESERTRPCGHNMWCKEGKKRGRLVLRCLCCQVQWKTRPELHQKCTRFYAGDCAKGPECECPHIYRRGRAGAAGAGGAQLSLRPRGGRRRNKQRRAAAAAEAAAAATAAFGQLQGQMAWDPTAAAFCMGMPWMNNPAFMPAMFQQQLQHQQQQQQLMQQQQPLQLTAPPGPVAVCDVSDDDDDSDDGAATAGALIVPSSTASDGASDEVDVDFVDPSYSAAVGHSPALDSPSSEPTSHDPYAHTAAAPLARPALQFTNAQPTTMGNSFPAPVEAPHATMLPRGLRWSRAVPAPTSYGEDDYCPYSDYCVFRRPIVQQGVGEGRIAKAGLIGSGDKPAAVI